MKYNEIKIGESIIGYWFCPAEEAVHAFLYCTGDKNLLHSNNGYAIEKGFKGRVVPGALLLSEATAYIGNKVPGNGALITTISSCRFVRPVYESDHLTIKADIIAKEDALKKIKVRIEILFRFSQELVFSGDFWVKCLE